MQLNNIIPSLVFLNNNDIKEIKLKGIDILYCDKPGRNHYIYPYEVVKEAVERWKENAQHDHSFRFIFARHPKDAFGDEEDYIYLAGLIDDLYFEGKTLKADVTLLKTVFGQLIKYLIDKGIKVGTSIRGKIIPEEKFIEKTINGKKHLIKYKVAQKMLLTGFDFVTFPSFIITGASKEHVVKEKTQCPISLLEEFISKYKIYNKDDDILCKLYGFCEIKYENIKEKTNNNNKNCKGEDKMGMLNEKDIELLKLKKQNLELEIEKLEQKKQEYEKLINKLRDDKNQNEKELENIRKEYEGLLLSVSKLKKEYEDLNEKINKMKFENVSEKARITEVEYKGKKYSLDDPPRIRIVPVSEKVDETPWGEIDKNMIRKLVYLSQKSRIANECFGLVYDGWKEDWKPNLKYPHHNLLPSEDPNYDLDLVLNYDGLMTAYKYMMGARGVSEYLNPEDRRKLARHLLKHFKQLKKAGYEIEIPEQLKNIAESTYLIENNVISDVFDALIMKGLIKIENKKQKDLDDEDIEFVKEKFDDETEEYILSKFAQTLYNTITEKTASEDFLSIISKTYQSWKETINQQDIFEKVKSMFTPESIIGQMLSIQSIKDGLNILNNIYTKLNSDNIQDKLSALERIKILSILSVFDTVDNEEVNFNFDDIELSLYFVNENFNRFTYVLENFEAFKTYLNQNQVINNEEQNIEQTPPEQPQQEQPQPTQPQSTSEQPEETTTLEKINNEEDEEMYKEKLEKIVKLLNENLESDEEITMENVEDVIGKIISGLYKLMDEVEEMKQKLSEFELKEYKEKKKKMLMKEGIPASAIENAFEKAKNIDDIDIISEVLINDVKNVVDIKRKGKSVIGEGEEKENDKFDKIFNRI